MEKLDATPVIIIVENYNQRRYTELLDQMFRLRARVFADKLGWNIQVRDGIERDPYDDLSPVYILAIEEDQHTVLGSLRLMPTTGPTLLYDVFHDTIPDAVDLISPSIWECTRFCVDDGLARKRGDRDIGRISGQLLIGLCEIGLRSGIEMIVGNIDPATLPIYRRAGCEVDILGQTTRFGGRATYLGAFEVSQRILNNMRAKQGVERPVVPFPAGQIIPAPAA